MNKQKAFLFIIMALTTHFVLAMEESDQEYKIIIEKENDFKKYLMDKKWPTSASSIQGYYDSIIANKTDDEQNQFKQNIVTFAKNTHPIIPTKVFKLCEAFLQFKKENGSDIEKSLYTNMTIPKFIERLYEKRPLVFMGPQDTSLLQGASSMDSQDFTKIGTDQQQEPLVLNNYLSYDEMKISALLGMASPTFFINKGDRYNKGIISNDLNSFENHGVYVGLVGARFEKPNYMEWQDIIITNDQNTEQKDYGLNRCNSNS